MAYITDVILLFMIFLQLGLIMKYRRDLDDLRSRVYMLETKEDILTTTVKKLANTQREVISLLERLTDHVGSMR